MRSHLRLCSTAALLLLLACAGQAQTPVPSVQWFSPSVVPLGQAVFTVNGSNFTSGAVVMLDGAPLPTTYVSPTQLKAASNAAQSGSGYVTVVNPGPPSATSSPRLIEFGQGITVGVSPPSASVAPGAKQQFTAAVSGASNKKVYWYVNGGSANGTITSSGLYTAPNVAPAGPVTVRAVSEAFSARSGTAAVAVGGTGHAVAVSVSPPSASVQTGATQQFTATVTGSANTAVTWQVNNVTGGNATVGTITSAGLYTAPNAVPSGSVTVTAVSQADGTKKASAAVAVADPQAVAVGRFLEHATFGPTPQLTAHVKQVGIQNYLEAQFNAPPPVFPNGNASSMNELTDHYYLRMLTGQDQVRQRVVHALSEIIVVSRNKNHYPNMLVPWLDILSQHAFGNYKALLKAVTLDASMGNFLDLANSTKPGVAGGANENYARELMQLFSIGLYQLNPDGSPKLDAQGRPIPTYTQADVRQLSLALTGWTYSTANSAPQSPNPNYHPGPMVPLPNYHDTSSKTFLGHTLPAGQTVQKDLDDAIEIIFNHPNVGPFVSVRLIRALVTSNPSAAYVARVSAVFDDNGQGVRGDLKAVVRAILLDADARDDNPPPDFGKLRSPLLHHIAVLRALGGHVAQPSLIAYLYENMGEGLLHAPSVFGHYSPLYRIPKQSPPLFGPEFQIHGPGELVNRGNFLWNYMNYYQTGIWDLQWLFSLGNDHAACVNAVDGLLLYGRMSQGLRQQLMAALQASASAGADAKTRALTALYLTAMSGEYLVMH
jgi:uncharacterized protein YjdB